MKEKLEQLISKISERLDAHAGTAGLYFSAGSDSLLLLHAALETGKKFSVITFDHSFTREQHKAVDKWAYEHDMKIFSYPPANAYLIGDGKRRVSMVEEYATVDGERMPFIRDCVQDDSKCAFDPPAEDRLLGTAPIGFTLNIFGSRKGDRHYATGSIWQHEEFVRGIGIYWAPLFDWKRDEVFAGLKFMNIERPTVETGDIPMCLKCLTAEIEVLCPKTGSMVPAVDWDPQAMTQAFRRKYGWEV